MMHDYLNYSIFDFSFMFRFKYHTLMVQRHVEYLSMNCLLGTNWHPGTEWLKGDTAFSSGRRKSIYVPNSIEGNRRDARSIPKEAHSYKGTEGVQEAIREGKLLSAQETAVRATSREKACSQGGSCPRRGAPSIRGRSRTAVDGSDASPTTSRNALWKEPLRRHATG